MTASHARAERHFRALIAAAGIAEPDHVEYAEASVAFFWDGPRVAVVVDLGEDDASLAADDLESLGLIPLEPGERLH